MFIVVLTAPVIVFLLYLVNNL